MDSHIRKLIGLAQNKFDQQAKEHLRKAYLQMKLMSEKETTSDGPEPFGRDLTVLCAEAAYQVGETDIACSCLSIYFNRTPPVDQFLCRAYMCQAQLNAPEWADDTDKLNKAVTYLLKAVETAKLDKRYHFLVFNASVIYWQLCRPMLKPNYRRHLSSSLSAIVKSLDDTNDADYEWRAELKIALIEAYLDANKKSEASRVAQAAVAFVQKRVPEMSKRLFGLMIFHHLSDSVEKLTKKSPEMGIYYKLCLLKRTLEENSADVNLADELKKILDDLTSGDMKPVPPGQTKPAGDRQVRSRVKEQAEEKLGTLARPYLLLELGRLAIEHCQPDIGVRCVEALKDASDSNAGFYCEVEFLKSQVAVAQLATHCESYQKSAVDVRLEAVGKCTEALLNAIRFGDPSIIQAGCVTQWNLCLPLFQSNLRKHVRRPLTIVAEALEKMNSLMVDLRCLLHTELAKCEEDEEQLAVAIDHVQKALRLDDGQVYREGLDVFLHRLQMCIQLYEQPQRDEDVATMIIEQARNTNSGTVRMKRSLLVKAGQALAPDDFLLVLEGESDNKDLSSIKDVEMRIKELSEKAKRYVACIQKAEGHLLRLGNKNDKERAHLWGDLAKVARKQEVWDVCRVAARFCLLYDDNRWQPKKQQNNDVHQPTKDHTEQEPAPVTSSVGASLDGAAPVGSAGHKEGGGGAAVVTVEKVEMSPYERNLVRLLAEIRFVSGEAVIHQLRSEGVELCDVPRAPIDTRKKPKGFIHAKAEDNPNWINYVDWIKSLSRSALSHFLRGAAIGAELSEPWLVCNAATYIWNYTNHLMMQHRQQEMAPTLQTMLDLLKLAGYAGNTCLVVGICNALALGLLQPCLPSSQPQKPESVLQSSPSPTGKSPRRARPVPATKQKSSTGFTMSPDAIASLKVALAVCEYAMAVTNGDSPADVVPIAVRLPLLQTFVQLKHWLQSSVGKSLGLSEESSNGGQDAMTRAMVAIEMMRNEKYSDYFKDPSLPSVAQAVELLELAEWTDSLVGLQMWTSLGHCALQEKDHINTEHCFHKAVVLAPLFETKKRDSHEYIVAQELLGYISAIYGQSLIQTSRGRSNATRKALGLFVQSASYGRNAKNGDIVMTAARHFWNGSLPLIVEATERELLRDPLLILLKCITETTDKNKYKISEEDEPEEKAGEKEAVTSGGKAAPQGMAVVRVENQAVEKSAAAPSPGDEDLAMRAALYCIVFQSFIDKGDWDGALKAMEMAIKDMPRTNHRMVIYRQLVVIKARLNLDVSAAMERFKHQSEDCVANIWRQVALSSKRQMQQLEAYQNAIEAIISSKHDWLKFEYLLEFAEWLYCNEQPLDDAINQLEWAIDILLNLNTEMDAEGKRKVEASTPPPPPPAKPEKSKPKSDRSKERSKPSTHVSPSPTPIRSSSHSDLKQRTDQNKSNPPPSDEAEQKNRQDEEKQTSDGPEISQISKFIPVKVDAEIGVLFRNPLLSFEDLSDMRQLDGLFRSYTLLARIVAPNTPQHTDHCLMAYAMVMQMWKVSVGSVGRAMKEIAKLPAVETPRKGAAKKKKVAVEESGRVSPKKKRKEADEAATSRPKHKLPIDALPSNLDEWSTYEVPDEVLQVFNHPVMASSTGVTSQTIQKPTLTLWYLDELMTMLRGLGFSHLALPVAVMADTVTRNVTPCRSLSTLIHLQSMEICQELNLVSGVQFHESFVEFQLNDEDQARAHAEIVVWRNKQSKLVSAGLDVKGGGDMVSRVQNDKKISADHQKATTQRCSKPQHGQIKLSYDEEGMRSIKGRPFQIKGPTTEKHVIGESQVHLFPELGKVSLRDVWLRTAEIMIRNCIYRPALQLLNETRNLALAFGDKPVLAKTLLQFGKLSFAEAQYKQAYSLTQQAQETYNGDEMFWFETTTLMSDAILKDPDINSKDRISQARDLLQLADEIFVELELRRPNKSLLIASIRTRLQIRLTSLGASIAMATFHDNGSPEAIEDLLAIDEVMDVISNRLMELGCRRDAVAVMREQSATLWKLAQAESVPEMKHGYYIEAEKILREASRISDAIYSDVQNISPLQDMSGSSLPVQRQSVELRITYAQLLLDMLKIHVEEEICEETRFQGQDSVTRVLNDLIRETPTYTSMGKEWHAMTRTLADDIMSQLTSAHGLSGNILELRAKTLYLMGRCLHLLSQLKSTDPPVQWNLTTSSMQEMRSPSHTSVSEVISDGSVGEKVSSEDDEDSKEREKYEPLMIRYTDNFNASSQFLYQATECLLQAVNLSLDKGYKAIVSDAALELVECIGQFDAGLSSQYLALYQSCQASDYLSGLLRQALTDPSLSQQAALFHQLDALQSNRIISNASIGPTFKSVVNTLEENSVAWHRLSVLPQHLDLMKEFPQNFLFLVLQHSPDRSLLYGSVLDKAKQFATTTKTGKPGTANVQSASRSRVVRMETSASRLDHILNQWKAFKRRVAQFLLKQEFQCTVQTQLKDLVTATDESMETKEQVLPEASNSEEELRLQDEFQSLLFDMEDYLQPVMVELDSSLRQLRLSPAGGSQKPGTKSAIEELTPECVVVLADQYLLELPLEALWPLHAENVDSVSRDISLQMFYHRFHVDATEGESDGVKKEKDLSKVGSKVAGKKGSAKKTGKAVVADRAMLPGYKAVDTNLFRYIVDPHKECCGLEEKLPLSVFRAILEEHSQFTSRWTGVTGDDQVPSVGQYEEHLLNGGSIIFYGMERFLAYLPPHKAAVLDLTESQIMILLDHSQTNASFGRQAKLDVAKSKAILTLENPLEAAMLLSLAGVRCCFTNQWHCSLKENALKVELLIRDLLAKGKSTGQALRRLADPQQRDREDAEEVRRAKELEEAVAATQRKAKEAKQKDGKDGRGGSAKKKGAKNDGTKSKATSPNVEIPESDGEFPESPRIVSANEEPVAVSRSSFGMVCYGLPNYVVVQPSKQR